MKGVTAEFAANELYFYAKFVRQHADHPVVVRRKFNAQWMIALPSDKTHHPIVHRWAKQ
jgi:hypothetical protein